MNPMLRAKNLAALGTLTIPFTALTLWPLKLCVLSYGFLNHRCLSSWLLHLKFLHKSSRKEIELKRQLDVTHNWKRI
jgi:hypothetical protein